MPQRLLHPLVVVVLVFATATTPAAPAAAPGDGWEMRSALVLPRVGRFGRTPFPRDPIVAALAAGTFEPPRIGTDVVGIDGKTETWDVAEADGGGWISGPAMRGGYALWTIEAVAPAIMILEASGHSAVHVGGTWRAGDPYQNNWVRLPVAIDAGRNHLLFHVSRGRVRAKLLPPPADVFFSLREPTLPDLVRGEAWASRGGVLVVNATTQRQEDLVVRAAGDGVPVHETPVGAIEPMTFRKVPFWLGGAAAPDVTRVPIGLSLLQSGRVFDEAAVTLRVRTPTERHRRTFLSGIDGSVQYYAVTPRDPAAPVPDRPAVYYTLHGASVEASRQAAVYRPKPDGPVIAPTNRRPFGFDWEDWGRLDALEVMERTIDQADPSRVYLTGHSMGGHGTWHIGVTFPGRFAAIGPSAGWRSFWSYTGAERFEDASPIETLLRRATNPSDTVQLTRNLLGRGVYILHGDKDDNVPVDQARFMHEHLKAFHPDVTYHEQPDAGHWWGDRCCDWPPMFEFFAARERPPVDEVDHIEFRTANPGVSASCDWITIEQQREMLAFSSVVADRHDEEVVITTENVASLRLDPAGFDPWPRRVTIDGVALTPSAGAAIVRLVATDGTWSVVSDPLPAEEKGPHRSGPFK
ncbi:MAG: prolyl oligopeptidase family serine peptidase, partial [Phycisphaerales bacterium]|nr:prolyl oligopeptidase family serine peptidase [Phycisphaerales bacterium]